MSPRREYLKILRRRSALKAAPNFSLSLSRSLFALLLDESPLVLAPSASVLSGRREEKKKKKNDVGVDGGMSPRSFRTKSSALIVRGRERGGRAAIS